MKCFRISLFLLLSLAFVACRKPGNPNAGLPASVLKDTTSVSFSEYEYDFGNIIEGESVTHVFTFTNTGKNDLIIANAVGSCGCTVPVYPKTPVKPGETDSVKVTFNSTGKSGDQNKSVTITCNTSSHIERLLMKGNVKPKTN
jgi:hypothetical protein